MRRRAGLHAVRVRERVGADAADARGGAAGPATEIVAHSGAIEAALNLACFQDRPEGRCESLLRLLAQQVICVGKQFCDGFGFRGVVVATDLTMSIHEHHSCAVYRKSLRTASV